ncbi:hypothetical protein GCM10009087_20010 [Sphingomonas oligophenolica]
MFRADDGRSHAFAAVHEAERQLAAQRRSKEYLALAGDLTFVRVMGQLLLGRHDGDVAMIQAAGGTGALRLSFARLLCVHSTQRIVSDRYRTPTMIAHLKTILFYRIAEGSISGPPFCGHSRQHRNRFVDITSPTGSSFASMQEIAPDQPGGVSALHIRRRACPTSGEQVA